MKVKEIVERVVNKLFCLHKWKCFKTIKVEDDCNGSIYHIWIFYCEKCGKFKKVKAF